MKRCVRQLSLVVVGLMCLNALSMAQPLDGNVSKVSTKAASFLEIPVGPRAIAMGSAFVGTSDDVSSLFWNPSGAARLVQREAMFTHTEWIADMNFDYAAIGVPLRGLGTLGFSFTSLSMSDMLVRTVERPDGTGERFSAGSFAVGVHYARNLSDRFSIGFTAKYISEHIWHMQSDAFAIDVGTLFTTNFLNGMRIGATISNFGSDMRLSGRDTRTFHPIDPNKLGSNERIPQNIELDSWSLPLNFQFGVATEILQTDNHVLTVAIDALHPSDNYESINVGAEYRALNFLQIRGGYHSLFLDDSEGGLTLGAGVLADIFGGGVKARVDYAYWDFGRLNDINVIAISVFF